MKKGLLIAAMITVVSLSASAQAKGKDRFANLQLTTQQEASVDSIRKIYDAKRSSLKGNANTTEAAKTTKMKEIRKEQTQAINSILTPEQKKQLKKESKTKGKKKD